MVSDGRLEPNALVDSEEAIADQLVKEAEVRKVGDPVLGHKTRDLFWVNFILFSKCTAKGMKS